MIGLYSTPLISLGPHGGPRRIGRISDKAALPDLTRSQHILLLRTSPEDALPAGFQAILLADGVDVHPEQMTENVFRLPDDQKFLKDGDVVRLDADNKSLATIYRRNSHSNTLIVTEKCNNFCLMCSVPPKLANDDYIVNEMTDAIKLMHRDTNEIILSGGEPTLLGEGFYSLLQTLKNFLPNTNVHVLSNGRRFSSASFTQKLRCVEHPHLMVGVPLYSDTSNIHDYVVQADGAFDQTVRGLLMLNQHNIRIELRIVVHKQTYARLPQLARFISRNLFFVDQILFMGLELTGLARENFDELWMDPAEYQSELRQAVEILNERKTKVTISNHQLCVLDKGLWSYSLKNNSDWQTLFLPACHGCSAKVDCSGFFASAYLRHSDHIRPILA